MRLVPTGSMCFRLALESLPCGVFPDPLGAGATHGGFRTGRQWFPVGLETVETPWHMAATGASPLWTWPASGIGTCSTSSAHQEVT
jgi:hypothetical protein